MATIHPTAIVDPVAKLDKNVTIGPYAYIEGDVEIGDGTDIGPHVCIYNGARIGKNVKIFQSAAVSNRPQDLKYAGEKTFFYVGDNSIIREFVTLHRGTIDTGRSKIGKDCLIMAYTHVAHDCVIGNNCIIANAVQVAGHVTIDDWVIVGGGSLLHQFGYIAEHSMLQGGSHVSKDVPPYVLAKNVPFQYMGLNTVGLRRRGFTKEDIAAIKDAYQILYFSGLNISDARQRLVEEFDNEYVTNIIKFIDKPKKRSILTK
ncbi:Acyl-[acyl-carrier-protein]--UDP-N-acetylglucosamine O-acyltransferase [hydrothermal vent metagenome]|uniref:Acyl-[acyl-carrier-protein]--UDP-N-acetylglucosamine O-acyltransferase n=1 Tax=hydrothermal vent metagenome TaxID=652676 RepID=A0A3B1D6H2_9ZZZZ